MMNLPEAFLTSMKKLLTNEYDAYIESFQQPRYYGLRVNTARISTEAFEKITPFPIRRIPFVSNGYYYEETEEPAKHPYYFAGLYYLQEPSAMTPAEYLPIEEGDVVLDLCAAPGGKTTELGAKLHRTGTLLANDISASRAKALLKNVELCGISNCYVTAETPEKLEHCYPETFDKILVDAPCSGEGMFRKEPSLRKSWLEKGPAEYHEMQKKIMDSAVKMLKPGGMLLYSTCTFSVLEDENTIACLLSQHPEMQLLELPKKAGFQDGIAPYPQCIRIYPHRVEGEGHFLALLQKKEAVSENRITSKHKSGTQIPTEVTRSVQNFLRYVKREDFKQQIQEGNLFYKDENVYLLPGALEYRPSLRYLRTGLHLGTMGHGKRFEPSQALAMALDGSDYQVCMELPAEDIRVIKYLKGETIALPEGFQSEQGAPVLVCAGGYSLGWGKCNGAMLKNKYASGWRMQ